MPKKFPAELCKLLPGQKPKEENDRHKADMIRASAEEAPKRLSEIERFINHEELFPSDTSVSFWALTFFVFFKLLNFFFQKRDVDFQFFRKKYWTGLRFLTKKFYFWHIFIFEKISIFDKKFSILTKKVSIIDQKFSILTKKKFRFLTYFLFLRKSWFLTKSFRFLTTIFDFWHNFFYFWQIFWYLTIFLIFYKILIFHKIFDFSQRFLIFDNFFDFWQIFWFLTKFLILQSSKCFYILEIWTAP